MCVNDYEFQDFLTIKDLFLPCMCPLAISTVQEVLVVFHFVCIVSDIM